MKLMDNIRSTKDIIAHNLKAENQPEWVRNARNAFNPKDIIKDTNISFSSRYRVSGGEKHLLLSRAYVPPHTEVFKMLSKNPPLKFPV